MPRTYWWPLCLPGKQTYRIHIKKPRGAISWCPSKEIKKHGWPPNLHYKPIVGGLAGGRGHGCGHNQTSKRSIMFNVSPNQAMDSLNCYSSQQQQQIHTNQEGITANNEPDSSTKGWGQQRKTSSKFHHRVLTMDLALEHFQQITWHQYWSIKITLS